MNVAWPPALLPRQGEFAEYVCPGRVNLQNTFAQAGLFVQNLAKGEACSRDCDLFCEGFCCSALAEVFASEIRKPVASQLDRNCLCQACAIALGGVVASTYEVCFQ